MKHEESGKEKQDNKFKKKTVFELKELEFSKMLSNKFKNSCLEEASVSYKGYR